MSAPPPLPPKNRGASAQPSSVLPPTIQANQTDSTDFFNPSFTTTRINSTTHYTSNPPPLPPKTKSNSSTTLSNQMNYQNVQTRNTPPIPSKPTPQSTFNNVVASDVFDSPFEDPFQYRSQPQVAQLPPKPSSSSYNPPLYSNPSHTMYSAPSQPSSSNPPLPQKKPPPNNTTVFMDNQGNGPSLNFNTTTSVKTSTVFSATQPYQSPELQTASNYIPPSMLDKSIPLDVKMNMNLSDPDTVNVNVNGINAKVPTKTMLKVASTAATVGVTSYQQSNKKQ